jgi:Tfp pilus assembly protein PilE
VKVRGDGVDKKTVTKVWECISLTENFEQIAAKAAPMSFAEPEDERPWPKITLLGLLVVLGMLGLLAALIVPSFLRSQAQGRLSACAKGGLHNIAVALEMYASDHEGRYPNELSQLTPDYLVQIPMCPQSKAEYVYKTGRVGGNSDGRLDNYYVVYCKAGHPRLSVPAGYPRYDPELGLIER